MNDIIVAVKMEKNGHIVLQTDAEQLPIEVVQEILDAVLAKVSKDLAKDLNITELIDNLKHTKKELRTWKGLAVISLSLFILALAKVGGVF